MLKIREIRPWEFPSIIIWFVYFNRQLVENDLDDKMLKSMVPPASVNTSWLIINNKEHLTYLMLKYA